MLKADCLFRKWLLPFLLVAWLPGSRAFGGDGGSMKELHTIMNRIKNIQTYSFVSEAHAVFPSGERDDLHTTVYMDVAGQRLFYQNEHQVLLLNRKWVFQADHDAKTARVFNVDRYNAQYKAYLPELQEVFKSNLAATFIDSVLLLSGKLKSAVRHGDLGTFVLVFPKSSAMQEFTLVYDYAKGLPESIRTRSYLPPSGGERKGTSYEMIYKAYSRKVPESVFDVGQYFQVSGKKVLLRRFKHYTISSIL